MTNSYDIALFFLQKISCFLSATGSLMIISQVSRSPFNRSKPQQRLILGLSLIDFCMSLIWILTPLFMPSDSGAAWAVGNQTTCAIQGFSVTLFNSAAILYMCSLQLQYLLTIKYGWTESRLHRKVERRMHAFPWGLSLASAVTQLALKLFNPANWDCWIAPYPSNCTSSHEVRKGGTGLEETDCIRGDNAEIYRWSLFFAPLWAAIGFCIVTMLMIFRSVREKELKSQKYAAQTYASPARQRQTRRQHSMLVHTQKVKEQCFMYAGAFFVVWTFPTIARLIQLFGGTIHPVIGVLAGTLIGIQGFLNAIIYFRPRYNKMEQPGKLARVWALIYSSLFFCCGEKNTKDSNNDYIPPPNRSTMMSESISESISESTAHVARVSVSAALNEDDNPPEKDSDDVFIDNPNYSKQGEPECKMEEIDGTNGC